MPTTNSWNSPIPVTTVEGGTGNITLTNRGVLIGRGTAAIDQAAAGSAGQALLSGGAAANPAYSTATYPLTTGAGEMVYSNSANAVISGSSLSGDFTYTTATAGATRTVTVSNSDNSNAASHAKVAIITGGANGGDAKLALSTTTTAWSVGIDNSITTLSADPFVISQNAVLGTNNAMSIDTTGAINYPLQPAFSYLLSSTKTNKTGNGTVYKLGTDALTKIFDQNSDFNTNGTFTAPVTGKYLISANVTFTGGSIKDTTSISIVTTARTYGLSTITNEATPRDISICGTAFCNMSASDTAYVDVLCRGEASDNIGILGSAPTVFTGVSGYLVC